MDRGARILERLPSLYRPERGGDDLLSLLIRSIGDTLEEADGETSDVLRSHWLKYADNAAFDGHTRAVSPPPRDLKRLASLLSIPGWDEPPETYRARIERTAKLYRNGIGTLNALRDLIESHLPPGCLFWIEEFASCARKTFAVSSSYEPKDSVGPLMDWRITNEGVSEVSPTIYVQGVQPQEGVVDATENPLIELHRSENGMHRVGIAYRGTITPEQTLRLMPAYASWLVTDDGLKRSQSLPTEESPADPSAPNPWKDAADAPRGEVTAVLQTADLSLWAAVNDDETGSLWRYDGTKWMMGVDSLPALNCLAEDGQHLLIGTGDGLLRMYLYPESNDEFHAEPVPAIEGSRVRGIFRTDEGCIWAATDNGAALLTPSTQTGVIYDLASSMLQGVEVYAIAQDGTGAIHFGTSAGLFQHHPASGKWHWFSGEGTLDDWREVDPNMPPSTEAASLPAVRCVHRGPDASVWIGTDYGIVRYISKSTRDFRYETYLEAFPDVADGKVFSIKEDERGLIWFCTNRGVFRYDGRWFWQFQGGDWVNLGRADRVHGGDLNSRTRGQWRFDAASTVWQRWDDDSSEWIDFSQECESAEGPAVRNVFWTDQVSADIGEWNGHRFIVREKVSSDSLAMRYKPEDTRIVNGGIPSIPRLPVGESVWRYLSLESHDKGGDDGLPDVSTEGRMMFADEHHESNEVSQDGFDTSIFPFNPAAKVWFSWEPRLPLSLLVRISKPSEEEKIDQRVLDEVWQTAQKARPAGAKITLAVGDEIVRGGEHGPTG